MCNAPGGVSTVRTRLLYYVCFWLSWCHVCSFGFLLCGAF